MPSEHFTEISLRSPATPIVDESRKMLEWQKPLRTSEAPLNV